MAIIHFGYLGSEKYQSLQNLMKIHHLTFHIRESYLQAGIQIDAACLAREVSPNDVMVPTRAYMSSQCFRITLCCHITQNKNIYINSEIHSNQISKNRKESVSINKYLVILDFSKIFLLVTSIFVIYCFIVFISPL